MNGVHPASESFAKTAMYVACFTLWNRKQRSGTVI